MTRIYPEEFLRGVPERLRPAEPPPSAEEFEAALRVRKQFLLDGQPEPYMDDVIRAFRLLRGCRSYVEVGTYDKATSHTSPGCSRATRSSSTWIAKHTPSTPSA